MSVLNNAELEGLHVALDRTYRAWATHARAIADFGRVPALVEMQDAQEHNIDVLARLLRYYGVPVPLNPWIGAVARFASLEDALAAAMVADEAQHRACEALARCTERGRCLEELADLCIRAKRTSRMPPRPASADEAGYPAAQASAERLDRLAVDAKGPGALSQANRG